MSPNLWIGLPLTLLAGLLAGNSMLPMKFARRWQWENIWLAFSLVSLGLLPWALALTLVRNLGSVYASFSPAQYLVPFLFGAGWGVAQFLFGLSVARLGLALGYNIIIGLGAVLGTLVPLFYQNRAVVGTWRGVLILTGVAIMLGGIVVSGWAGRLRERAAAPSGGLVSGSYGAALWLAILCGLLAPMLNYSFAFGQHFAREAVRLGTDPANAGYAVWPVGLAGGLVPNVIYCAWRLTRNRSWALFRAFAPDLNFAILMAIFWVGAISLYGMGTAYLGALGTSVGWALFQIFMIMTANVSGVLTGEWRGAPRRAMRGLWTGLLLLAFATVAISLGNR